MFDTRKEAEELYRLNERALKYRNSKEYFIGERISRYIKFIKTFRFISFFSLLINDVWRVIFKKKRNPIVQEINFKDSYIGPRIAVYTSIYGSYDTIYEPLYKDLNCDYFIFTDQEIKPNSVWKKVEFMEFPSVVNTNFLKNRYVKMFPHKVLKDYRYTIYVDGNIQVVSEVSLLFKSIKSKSGIAMHKHPSNTSIYEELIYNKRLGKITSSEAKKVKLMYKENNMPSNYGMFECNVICRDSYNTLCNEIMKNWFDMVFGGVKRDQLYFTYVLYKMGIKFNDIDLLGENINANPMFIRYSHK